MNEMVKLQMDDAGQVQGTDDGQSCGAVIYASCPLTCQKKSSQCKNLSFSISKIDGESYIWL